VAFFQTFFWTPAIIPVFVFFFIEGARYTAHMTSPGLGQAPLWDRCSLPGQWTVL